jgi:single-strand DNA-binding protein
MKNRTLNQVLLIGNLVRKPQVNKTTKGISVCNFHVITNHNRKDKDGNVVSEGVKHNCLAWDKLAEICGELLDRGDLIFIEGRLSTRPAVTESERSNPSTVIVVNDMILLDKKLYQTGGSNEPRSDYSQAQ